MSITRRQFIGSSAFAIAGPALLRTPFRLSAQQAQQVPVTRFEDLRGGVGIFTGSGGTIGWLVTPDGAIAVDSQFTTTAPACIEGLRQRSPKGIQMLINTHHHGDHVSGNPSFRPVVTRIVQQERCAKYHKDTTEKAGTAAQQAFADVTFGSSWSTSIGGEKVWAKYYGAGHTGGDCIVVFEKANVVHMGDLMFNKMHPFIDRPNGASFQSWTKALTKVADDHKDALFICGHAKQGLPITGARPQLLAFRDYLSALLDLAEKGIRAKRPLEEIVKVAALPGFEDYQESPPRLSLAGNLAVAHEELTAR
jgi:glyoxylase-like metal-dependent hydrolase (beta-lactamase superfamily II)